MQRFSSSDRDVEEVAELALLSPRVIGLRKGLTMNLKAACMNCSVEKAGEAA